MLPANVGALSDTHPPHTHHRVVLVAIVLAIVQHSSNVAVAVVAANVVHPTPVGLIRCFEALVVDVQLSLG